MTTAVTKPVVTESDEVVEELDVGSVVNWVVEVAESVTESVVDVVDVVEVLLVVLAADDEAADDEVVDDEVVSTVDDDAEVVEEGGSETVGVSTVDSVLLVEVVVLWA